MAIKLEIVTPEELFFSENVEMATLPGVEGEFGVLADHSPLISELQEGQIGDIKAALLIQHQFIILMVAWRK